MIGVAIIVLEVLLVIFLPMILKLDPYTSDILAFSAKPGPGHFLGTDDTGRDVFARLVYGGRVSLMVGLLSAVISLLIGVPLGLVAGYYKGIWETIVMRAADIFMSFPSMILVLVLVSVIGPSVWTVTLVIGVLGWTDFAKLIYGNVLSVREKEYVESAKAVGTRDLPLLLKYVVPNAFAPILINLHSVPHRPSSRNPHLASWAWASSRRRLPGAISCTLPSPSPCFHPGRGSGYRRASFWC